MLTKGKRTISKPILPKVGGDNMLPTAMICLAASSMVLGFCFLWMAISLSKISNSKNPTLVQSTEGVSFSALPQDYTYRTPKLLQNTARNWAILTFSWGETASSAVAGSISLTQHSSGEIPLSAYKASMLLSDDFRDSFLQTYTTEVFTEEAKRGALSSLYVPLQVLPPEELTSGRWEVEVLGSRYISTPQNPAGTIVPANFLIEMIATDIPQSPLKEDAAPGVKAVYELFESGIRITHIEELPSAGR